MARLFIGQKEIDFVNDLTKEFIKDVVGQVVHYYPISYTKSLVHGVYNEAVEKIFENPIKIPALVGMPEFSSKTTSFGPDIEARVDVLFQYKDLQDKGVVISEGDMFSYDDTLYEILTVVNADKNIFGLAEHNVAWKVTARNVRASQFAVPNINIPRTAPEGTQLTFEQQRGLPITSTGESTGDKRDMRERLDNQMASIALGTGAKKVEPSTDSNNVNGDETASFNNDPLPPKLGIYDE